MSQPTAPSKPGSRMATLARGARWTALALLAAGYFAFAHWSTAAAQPTLAGALVAVGPVLALAVLMAWRSSQPMAGLLLVIVASCLLWAARDFVEQHFSWVYFVQHAGTNALLAGLFGRTLRAGETPLCTRLAEMVHRPTVPPIVARYTRQVTVAWTVFFALSAVLSTLLFAAAPVEIWSFYANLLGMPLVGLMFVGEYLVRCRVLPREHRPTLMETVRAYRQSAKAGDRT